MQLEEAAYQERTRPGSAARPSRSPRCDALSSSRRSAANGAAAFPPAAAAAAIHREPLSVRTSLHGAPATTCLRHMWEPQLDTRAIPFVVPLLNDIVQPEWHVLATNQHMA